MIKWAKFRKMIEKNGTFINFMIKSTLGFVGNNNICYIYFLLYNIVELSLLILLLI